MSAKCANTSEIDQRSGEGFHCRSSVGKSRSIVSKTIGVFSKRATAGWKSVAGAVCMCTSGETIIVSANAQQAEAPGSRAGRFKTMAIVAALMDDLFFQMKVAETAKQLGLQLKVAANGEALLALLESSPKLIIVD